MSFAEIRIGDVLTFQRGFDITKAEQAVGTIPIVSSSGISSFHSQWKVKAPGIVIGRKGTLGTTHFLQFNFWPHDTTLWIKDFKGNDPKFLYYFLQTLHFENFDTGSSNPTLNRNHLHKIAVRFSTLLATQRKIAAILSAYDDLIANNQRRITLLERMAEDIYREWFVRLRFPGHGNVKVEKGVPQGWTLVKTEKAFKFYGGATPARGTPSYWQNGDINWYTPTDITAASGLFLSESSEKCAEDGLRNCSSTLFPPYSVMMTSRATIGAIGINLTPACTNQGFITCIPNEAYPLAYLYHWLKLGKPHIESLSGGSTFAELTKGTFKRMEILTPPHKLVAQFQTLIDPVFKSMEAAIKANVSLKAARDALLPRLISGKLSVDALDIRFPPGMQTPEGYI